MISTDAEVLDFDAYRRTTVIKINAVGVARRHQVRYDFVDQTSQTLRLKMRNDATIDELPGLIEVAFAMPATRMRLWLCE